MHLRQDAFKIPQFRKKTSPLATDLEPGARFCGPIPFYRSETRIQPRTSTECLELFP